MATFDNNDDADSVVVKYDDNDDNDNEMDEDHDDKYHHDDDDHYNGTNGIIRSAPTLYVRPSYYKQTRKRRGKIIKTVTEMYLREDLGFGCYYVQHQQQQPHKNASNNRHVTTTGQPQTIQTIQHLISLLQPCKPYSIVICDTNVLIHNLDVLEQSMDVIPNIVIPQTAIMECRSNRIVAYDRTVELIRSVGGTSTTNENNNASNETKESKSFLPTIKRRCCIFFPDTHHANTAHVDENMLTSTEHRTTTNDINDARIRNVAAYFGQHLQGTNIRVVLLTDDKACREIASMSLSSPSSSSSKKKKLLYEARSVRSWVQELEQYNTNITLSDLVAQYDAPVGRSSNSNNNEQNPISSSTSSTLTIQPIHKNYFVPHLDSNQLLRGIQSGIYYRGTYRSVNELTMVAMVTIRRGDERVAVTIRGVNDRNRAVDGDVVAIALHPLEKWIQSSLTTTTTKTEETASSTSSGGIIASDVAEPTLGEIANVPETMSLKTTTNGSDDTTSTTWRPTGYVVGIIRRNLPTLSGSIYETRSTNKNEVVVQVQAKQGEEQGLLNSDTTSNTKITIKSERDQIAEEYEREHNDGTTTCVFFPVDIKIPPILIRTSQRHRLVGNRIVVTMDSWPITSPLPLGHYVRTLGPTGTKDVETQVLLYEYNIPHEPFPASVLACLPPLDYKIDLANSPGRMDLRHLPILSIDPPGCKDIDDALHCIVLSNGNYQVGVHIADVTHYVKAGTAIDIEAANRSTSTYLVNKRLDMLPGLLTTDLCSLKGGVDRFAFSVLWEVTPNGDIVHVHFHKSMIHSIAALTYQQAQSMIDQPDDEANVNEYHEYGGMDDNNDDEENDKVQVRAVKRLALLARKFRKRRIDAGALTLASPEVKFVLDSESLNPTDVQAYALLEANAVVEEFMLLANVTVAKKILRHYPTLSVLRRHPAPNRSMFDSLISKAKNCRNIAIDIDDSKKLADSLDAAVDPNDPYINTLLRILSTRCMSPAQYFCSGEYRPEEWHHYGLAAPVYTHFTSPIRRYADVCVHRLLAAAIGVAPLPQYLSSRSYLHDLCETMNRRHRSAQLAGRASVQLHTVLFFASSSAAGDEDDQDRDGTPNIANNSKEEYAYVLDVETTTGSEPCITVIVPRYGIEGRVRIDIASNDPNLQRIPEQHKLIYQFNKNMNNEDGSSSIQIQVFDRIKVKLWVRETDDQRRDLVMELVEPQFPNQSTTTIRSSGSGSVGNDNSSRTVKHDRIEETTLNESLTMKRQKLE